jgi:hypothetical protein
VDKRLIGIGGNALEVGQRRRSNDDRDRLHVPGLLRSKPDTSILSPCLTDALSCDEENQRGHCQSKGFHKFRLVLSPIIERS